MGDQLNCVGGAMAIAPNQLMPIFWQVQEAAPMTQRTFRDFAAAVGFSGLETFFEQQQLPVEQQSLAGGSSASTMSAGGWTPLVRAHSRRSSRVKQLHPAQHCSAVMQPHALF
jgi:hypothetical protein